MEFTASYIIQYYLSKFDIIKLEGTFEHKQVRLMFPGGSDGKDLPFKLDLISGWEVLEKGINHSSILA